MFSKLSSVPDLPGVYLFRDGNGKVVYVGKAKSLRKRLASHLNASDPNSKSFLIVKSSKDFEYIVVKNEKEALITEAQLIREHLPKFNVLLKDDKSYPYLVITSEEFPRLVFVREKDNIEGRKFGPFIPAKNARLMKDFIEKVFKLRKCKELKKRQFPCIQYHMERCSAPCCGFVDRKTYRKQVEGAISFLEGNVKRHIEKLYAEIEKLSKDLKFERAALLRDQLISLKNIYEKNSLFFDKFRNCNVYYIEMDPVPKGVLLIVRNGVIYGKEVYHFNELPDGTVYRSTLGTMWVVNTVSTFSKPEILLTNFEVEKDPGIDVQRIPEEMVPLIRSNLKRDSLEKINQERLLREFRSVFEFKLPERIEVFDVSTLQGSATVASCVVWENWRLKKSDYRKFKIRTVKGVDDYASMSETLLRRFKNRNPLPGLVVIDGGLGHLKVALKIKDELKLDFRVFSLAKREEVLYTDLGEVVKLKEYPELFKFFTQLRDEAHRFAISYNRSLRNKKLKEEIFEGIKGIGKKRKDLIEKFYPNLNELVHISPEELAKIGIPKHIAAEVIERVRRRYGG